MEAIPYFVIFSHLVIRARVRHRGNSESKTLVTNSSIVRSPEPSSSIKLHAPTMSAMYLQQLVGRRTSSFHLQFSSPGPQPYLKNRNTEGMWYIQPLDVQHLVVHHPFQNQSFQSISRAQYQFSLLLAAQVSCEELEHLEPRYRSIFRIVDHLPPRNQTDQSSLMIQSTQLVQPSRLT